MTKRTDLLTTDEASAYLGLSASTLRRLRDGPTRTKLTRTDIRYLRRDLDAWIEARRENATQCPSIVPRTPPGGGTASKSTARSIAAPAARAAVAKLRLLSAANEANSRPGRPSDGKHAGTL